MRILQVNKFYYPITGGIEKTVQQISEGLSKEHSVKVLVCQPKGKGKFERINGVPVYKTGSFGTYFSVPISLSFLFKFRELSKNSNIIQLHMPFPMSDIACLLSNYKGKVVIWWHSDIVRQKKLFLLYKPLMNKLLKRADAIIVATEEQIIHSNSLGNYREKCVIIPFGVNKRFEKESDDFFMRTKKNDASIEKITTFLFVGRLVYYKGCMVLIDAFKKVKNAQLIIIGDGPLKKELYNRIKKYDLQNKVHIYSNISDKQLPYYFKKCDVFVLPSIEKSEAFGLVQLEAMSYAKPVINTNLKTGVPTVSIHKKTGLTVEPNNIKQLTEAMNWMSCHPYEREILGKNAKVRVKNFYQEEEMLRKIEQLYAKLLKSDD